MSIDVFVAVSDGVLTLPTIDAGAPPASLTDYSTPGTEIVVIACHADDSGGELLISSEGATVERGSQRLLLSKDLRKEADIPSGGEYRRPFTLSDGRRGTLIVRHRGRWQAISIPL